MHDWRRLVRERLAPLGLNPAAELDLAEEVAQHLEDRYRELRSGGMSERDAYVETLSELADMTALQTGLQRAQRIPKHDPAPIGERTRGHFIEALWRD